MQLRVKTCLYCILYIGFFFSPKLAFSNDINIEDSELIKSEEKDDLNSNPYILGEGDVLKLNIYGLPEISGEINVLNDGTINLPFVGNIYVSGKKVDTAANIIRKSLSKELLNPNVQLLVLKPRPIQISLTGEISRPGIYLLNNDPNISKTSNSEIKGLPTLIDAIEEAGGITKKANLKEVVLKRKLPGNDENFKQAKFNLLSLMRDGDLKQNPFLFDGDKIHIRKRDTDDLPANNIKASNGNLTANTMTVYIVGEVVNPGEIELDINSTLMQGILASGGLKNPRANKGRINILREESDGTLKFKNYSFNLRGNLSRKQNPLLNNGDTVFVRTSYLAKAGDNIETISKPIGGILQIMTFFKLLND